MENRWPGLRFIFFFILTFIIGLVFLGLFRLSFLFRYHELIDSIPWKEIRQAFRVGLRFDMVIVSYLLIPFFLIGTFLHTFRLQKFRKYFLGFMVAMFSFCFFLSIIDLEFFGVYNSRLNLLAVQYLDTPGPVFQTIYQEYPVIFYIFILVLITAAFGWLIFRLGFALLQVSMGRIFWSEGILFLLLLSFLVLGARGTLASSPLNWGYAYFSEHNFSNQLALNGIFTLSRSLLQELQEGNKTLEKKLRIVSDDEAIRVVRKLVINPHETCLSPKSYPLVRRQNPLHPASSRPNIVIFIMESFTARFVSALGGPYQVTPEFDQLCREGILFDHFYANGSRTNHGLTAILCSYPCLTGLSLMKKVESQQPMLCLAGILKPLGYQNCFIYGGDLQFDNMEGFFRRHGFSHFIGQHDFPQDTFQSEWGISDEMVFDRANQEFSCIKEPFVGVVLTVSNHEPYNIPKPYAYYSPEHFNSKFLNAMKYSDWALGQFFQKAQQEPYFQNTIFVVVADHGRGSNHETDLDLHQFHIPCLFYAPNILKDKAGRIETIGGQIDIIPTLLGLLRVPVIHHSWGRDLLDIPSDQGYAMITSNDYKFGLVKDLYYVIARPDAPSSLYLLDQPSQDRSIEFPQNLKSMEQQVRIMAQASYYLFTRKRCWNPELAVKMKPYL